jgi:hypothetical protein
MMNVAAQRQEQSARRLHAIARRAPVDAIEATARVLDVMAGDDERAAFLTWMLNTLAENEIGDMEGLVTALDRPDVLAILRRRDPLAAARLRGLRARKQLLDAEGGTVSGQELAKAIGITRQAVDKRRLANTVIGIDLGKRGYAYPVWQVGLNGLDAVLVELNDLNPWSQALFFLSPNSWLDGETPLAALRRGERDVVLSAARHYGDQTAA